MRLKEHVTATCPEAASTMEVPSAKRAVSNSEWPDLLPLSRPSPVLTAPKIPALHRAGHSQHCQGVSEASPGLL